jgi:hypothetical protein
VREGSMQCFCKGPFITTAIGCSWRSCAAFHRSKQKGVPVNKSTAQNTSRLKPRRIIACAPSSTHCLLATQCVQGSGALLSRTRHSSRMAATTWPHNLPESRAFRTETFRMTTAAGSNSLFLAHRPFPRSLLISNRYDCCCLPIKSL